MRLGARSAELLLALTLVGVAPTAAQTQTSPPAVPGSAELQIGVLDENGVVVRSARVTLTSPAAAPVEPGVTDFAGRIKFTGLTPGGYALKVEKEGFYATTLDEIRVGEVATADVILNHVREFSEQVNVVYSPPAIDPAKTQASDTLNNEQIIDLPFAVTRDIRYALPLLPGVLQDSTGQLHVNGASTRQVYDQLDGFNISDPASGQFLTRVSVDALRSVNVAGSRYSTEYGKGSGGMISLLTGMGDDHWRWTATDFIPTVQQRRGLHPNTWSPRGMVSGPLRKGKAWFMDALEGEYDLNIFTELPVGADRYAVWHGSNLSKVQINLAPNNNLMTSLLVNYYRSPHSGLDPLDPISTTLDNTNHAFLFTVKDQHLFHDGTLLEGGVAVGRYYNDSMPMGSQPYIVTPNGTNGNYFATDQGQADRTEGIGNLFVRPLEAAGKHEIKVGFDADQESDQQTFNRRPYSIERTNGTLSDFVSFANGAPFTRVDEEMSVYLQDRWSVTKRWLLEPGVRFDWDDITRQAAPSPRLASTYLLKQNGDTKVSWGIGIYRDPSNLDILTRSLTGVRTDSFYDATGMNLIQPPVVSTFTINDSTLRLPQINNWSVELEQKLPKTTYLRLQFIERRGHDIWTFINPAASTSPTGPFAGQFTLTNDRHDHYDAAEVALRHAFKQNHVIFASYTRSRALTNADFNYNIDAVLFSPQAGGPLAWDTPNRFLSWGFVPLFQKLDAAYSVDWRDGYPFTLLNDEQQLVGAPGSRRFPQYFTLNLSLERRFTIFGFQWALRGGIDNLTRHDNPAYVNSNVDSPNFLTYTGNPGRAFTARIRLLGRK
jgi:hypothetical protein